MAIFQILAVLVTVSASHCPYHAPASRNELAVPQIHIALQEGFADDTVVVRINGAEVLNEAHITTRTQIGFAQSLERTVEEPSTLVEVELPLKGKKNSIQVMVQEMLYLGVSVRPDGEIVFSVSKEPFGYL